MSSYLVGFIFSLLVTLLPILFMAKNKAIYISLEGILVVIGGTIAIALASYPIQKVKLMLKCIFVVTRKEIDDKQVIATEIIKIAQSTRGERGLIQAQLERVRHPFIKDGLLLILDKLEDDLESILSDKIVSKKREDEKIIGMIKNLAKFPPALGLLATVLSLITLLDGLGGGDFGMASLGPAMAIGLVGTLYGIVLANMVFAPVAENLAAKSALDQQNRQIALTGLVLIAQKRSPVVIQEMVNAMMPPGARVDILGLEEKEAA